MKPLNNKDLANVIFANLKIILGTSKIKSGELAENPNLKEQLAIMALNMMITNQTVRDIHEINIDKRVKSPERRYEKNGNTFYVLNGGEE